MWLPLICFVLALLFAGASGGGAAAGGGNGGGELHGVYVVYMGAVPPRTSPNILQETHLRLIGAVLKRKLIGARYYDVGGEAMKRRSSARSSGSSPRDEAGHGTHTSSTAAGNAVTGASYYGLAAGTAKGGSASSRVAMYRVCSEEGCAGSAILAGFDDAIADGVDVISVSLGASPYFRPDFSDDPIAIGSFHAVAKGVMVVCSAGNAGPDAATVVNAAPWILTVAASTIDRYFQSDVVLGGNNTAVKGGAINFSNLNKTPKYPLITGESAKSSSVSDTESASHCEPGTLDASKIKGKIVLCHHSRNSDTSKTEKIEELKSAGAVGSVLVNDLEKAVATAYIDFPVTEITSAAAADIHKYIASTSEPVATITPTITVTEYKPAPVVAYFSSRGPSAQTPNILKPDVAAPGVNILASWIPTSTLPAGEEKPSQFNLVSGTSMACPHVAGVAATIKAWNPTWSPAAIRSSIMTTATQLNNDKAPVTTDSGSLATPYDHGAGQVNPTAALDAGLVYELGDEDYLQFLCNYGYDASQIKLIAASLPGGFSCGAGNASNKDLISGLNYPSISVTGLDKAGTRTVNRVVTNVGAQQEASYTVAVTAPAGLDVKVVPSKLEFTKSVKKLGFQVSFSGKNAAAKGDLSGSITWSDGKHTAPVTTDSGSLATPYDHGAGQVNPTAALDAGLVYELGDEDYLQFLCNYGYDASQIKLIAASLPGGFSCGAGNASNKDLISGLNYPSISVTGLDKAGTRTVNRVVTNVGAQQEASYTVAVTAPAGLDVKVVPSKLEFTKSVKKLGFQVSFSGKNAAAKGDLSGSITWSDGKHTVRSPFVVTF
uniref:Subtilisin-like protease n=1 Tax=Oryza punctata TaxID=4537 RepID=A0A0E0M2M9_ORYPU